MCDAMGSDTNTECLDLESMLFTFGLPCRERQGERGEEEQDRQPRCHDRPAFMIAL